MATQNNRYSLYKVYDYLYDMTWKDLGLSDYDYAINYFLQKKPVPNPGACTTVRNGNYVGRNFDWLYGNEVSFMVKTEATGGSHATIGMSGAVPGLTRDFVERKESSDMYQMVPFMLVDGINDAGLMCSMHVVPLDLGATEGTEPEVYKKYEICGLMLPRFILDKFSTALEAAEYIRDYVSVFTPTSIIDRGYDLHFFIADSTSSYCLEFIYNELEIVDVTNKPYMTNFHLYDVTFNLDGSVYTPATQHDEFNAEDTNGISQNGSGLERFNLINYSYQLASSSVGMKNLMETLRFTNAYRPTFVPYWFTEFVGDDLSVTSDPEDFADIVTAAVKAFEERVRGDGKTWHTVHTTLYDLERKTMTVISQEDDSCTKTYDFVKGSADKHSILTSVKKLLGIQAEYTHFDADLIMHINSVFVTLGQLGAGPAQPFTITGDSETWADFFGNRKVVSYIQTYVGLKVRYAFDPPVGGVKDALESTIAELEWRINLEYDGEYFSLEERYEELDNRVTDLETRADDNDLRWRTLVGEE